MPEEPSAILTPDQWEARDYRQAARELDGWARSAGAQGHDSTEYVAKLGLDESGSVIVMNRAHDRVLVPPPARPILAAFALVELPSGLRRWRSRYVFSLEGLSSFKLSSQRTTISYSYGFSLGTRKISFMVMRLPLMLWISGIVPQR